MQDRRLRQEGREILEKPKAFHKILGKRGWDGEKPRASHKTLRTKTLSAYKSLCTVRRLGSFYIYPLH
jgi:hypothetical protein